MADRLRKGSVRCAATMVCLQFCLHNLGPGLFGGESFHDKAAVLAFTSPAIRQIACDPGRGSSAFHDNAGTPSGHSMIMLARPVGHAQRALQVSGTIFATAWRPSTLAPSPQLGGPPGLWHHLRIGGESFHDKAAVLAFTSPAIRQIACDPGRGSSAFHDNAGTPSGGEGIEPGRAEEVLPGREARNDLGEVSADGEHQVSGTGRREDAKQRGSVSFRDRQVAAFRAILIACSPAFFPPSCLAGRQQLKHRHVILHSATYRPLRPRRRHLLHSGHDRSGHL
jgi:hypothetical protein